MLLFMGRTGAICREDMLHAVHRNTAAATEHAFEYWRWQILTVYNLWNVA
jgi:hypothetical protein